ncbi:MAG: hypothetical protein KR126chlam1_01328 [Chlamydiae bacterium]|nr:hypothetical protein [Chlamydiota bacterium]
MKKETLKNSIFDSAWKIVEDEGMERLNVRKVAKMSECSLGSLYNSYESFQILQLHINATVLSNLFVKLRTVTEEGIQEEKTLREILKNLGLAYIEFGQENRNLWKSVFEHFPVDPLPEWYAKRAREGVYGICERLGEFFKLPQEEVKHIVGFFWTSIHGMSAILLNRKMEMVAELFRSDSLESYVDYCLEGLFSSELVAKIENYP